MSKSKGSDHIDDMLEWENKQYTPWNSGVCSDMFFGGSQLFEKMGSQEAV